MSTALRSFQEKAQQLSPAQLAKVLNLMEELLAEENPQKRTKPTFDWADDSDDTPATDDLAELNGDDQTFDPSRDNKRNLAFDWVVDSDAEPEPLTSVELQHLATQLWAEKLERNLDCR